MNEEELKDRIAYMETVNDQLESEVEQFDGLMRMLGFVNGAETVKETAQDIYQTDNFDDYRENEEDV